MNEKNDDRDMNDRRDYFFKHGQTQTEAERKNKQTPPSKCCPFCGDLYQDKIGPFSRRTLTIVFSGLIVIWMVSFIYFMQTDYYAYALFITYTTMMMLLLWGDFYITPTTAVHNEN